MWTGNSFDSIQLLIFITNVDKHNSITFYPSSHFLGLLPVKNRKLDENNFKLKNKNVFLIFHRDRFLGVDSEFAEKVQNERRSRK